MIEDVQLNIINVLTGSAVQIQVATDTRLGDICNRLASVYELSLELRAQRQHLCEGDTIVDTQVVRGLPTLELQFIRHRP